MTRRSTKTSKTSTKKVQNDCAEITNDNVTERYAMPITIQSADKGADEPEAEITVINEANETTITLLNGSGLNENNANSNDENSHGVNEGNETITAFHDYDPSHFSPLYLYRPQNDVVGSLIVHSSSEGAGRYEIGRKIGMNTKSKTGNRRVSQSIQLVTKYFPQHIGQYQKMEGKYRMIKYFLKASKPECHQEMFKRFKEITDRDCPFKFGDVLKFPNTKLNTLRITDITMKRMVNIVQALKDTPIILTSVKLVRYIQEKDAQEGYPFRIDKKSAAKCLLALCQHKFCRLFETEYLDEGVKRPLEVITSMAYDCVDDPAITAAIEVAAAEYVANNKIFPTGTPRPWKKTSALSVNTLGLEAEEDDENSNGVRRQDDAKHLEHLKEVLKTKNELPLVSEKTRNFLTFNYRRRKGIVASTKKKNLSSNVNENNSIGSSSGIQASSESFSLLPLTSPTANSILAANQDLAAVMDSSSLSNIKQELVNALSGCTSSPTLATDAKTLTPEKRRRKRKATETATTEEDTAQSQQEMPKKKKRMLDEVDKNCINQQIYMRNRFTTKERDMLILIRAVGFFLNPIHRFWLDPTVMRNIMHEYVPESRCKTASSLLAAGSRDLARNDRMAHLQYIVKTLSSYEEMRELRNRLPTLSLENVEAKNTLFHEAFTLAYELLFKHSQSFPSVKSSDAEFDEYLSANNMQITSNLQDDLMDETFLSVNDFPRRSINPSNEKDTKHCVNFNVIISILLNDDKTQLSFLNDPVMKTVGSEALGEGLEQLHRDGLVAKVRSADRLANIASEGVPDLSDPVRILRNQINLSVFFRHFFYHSYHNDLMTLTKSAMERFKLESVDETLRSDVGSVVLLSRCLTSNKYDIDFTVPESLDALFSTTEEKEEKSRYATKRMRELEDADLHIDLMCIKPIGVKPVSVPADAATAIASLSHKVPIDEIESAKSRDCTTAISRLHESYHEDAILVYKAVESSEISGLSEEELVNNTKLDPMRLKKVINLLTESYDIFPCGIDKRRYVLMQNADCWMVRNEKFGFFPRPWSTPSGENNMNILKWIAESILVLIHKKPGIMIQELINSYAFVIQPIIVEEILCLLEMMDASHIHIRSMLSLMKTSTNQRTKYTVRYAMPTHDGLEKFTDCFKKHI